MKEEPMSPRTAKALEGAQRMSVPEHETDAGIKPRVAELEDENACLQERVEAERDLALAGVRVTERERDRYKALAERRKEALVRLNRVVPRSSSIVALALEKARAAIEEEGKRC